MRKVSTYYPYSTPPAAKVETKNHHKTMMFEVPEAEILRTPIKIEKLSLWNRSRSGFIMNFEFHAFLEKKHSLPVHYFATSFGREIVYFATSVYIKEIVYFATQGYVKEIVYFATRVYILLGKKY